MSKLLTRMETNTKTAKDIEGIEGALLSLYPDKRTCPVAHKLGLACLTQGLCIADSGRGAMGNVRSARQRKTADLFRSPSSREAFLTTLRWELGLLSKRAARKGFKAVARLNTFSDVSWERFGIPQEFGSITFYDYAKCERRAGEYASRLVMDSKYLPSHRWPSNYHLTYSYHEKSKLVDVAELIACGVNVAVPFVNEFPSWITVGGERVNVIDGDASDARWKDPQGVIVGLSVKRSAAATTTGADWFADVATGNELPLL